MNKWLDFKFKISYFFSLKMECCYFSVCNIRKMSTIVFIALGSDFLYHVQFGCYKWQIGSKFSYELLFTFTLNIFKAFV